VQASEIRQHSVVKNITVAELTGKNVTEWNERNWSVCLAGHQVLVGVDEVLRANMIDKRYIRVLDLCLCIFDECHHTKGNSPMAGIIKAIHATPMHDQPRIVGLTASFNDGNKNHLISKRIDLETLLLSTMWAPSQEKIAQYQQKATLRRFESVNDWRPPQEEEKLNSWARTIVEKDMEELTAAVGPVGKTKKVGADAAHVLIELGIPSFIYYLEHGIFPELEQKADTRLDLLREEEGKLTPDDVTKHEDIMIKMKIILEYQRSLPQTRTRMQECVSRLQESLASPTPNLQLVLECLEFPDKQHTQKARRLLLLLREINKEKPKKGIIFVQQNALLYPLEQLLREDGHRVGAVGGGASMSNARRKQALEDFKKSRILWLVSTPVLEEGHDVQDCQVVMLYVFVHFSPYCHDLCLCVNP